jgi:hypothetical protein
MGQFTPGGVRIYEEELRVKLDQQRPAEREMGFDAGGWFNFAYMYYTDAAAGRRRNLSQYQLRGWASMNLKEIHKAYVRGLLNYNYWGVHDNPSRRNKRGDFDEELERAWYEFDLGQLLRKHNGERPPVDMRVRVGRQFTTIGTSLVLSMPLDAIKFNVGVGDWEFMALLGKTIHKRPNIDDSPLLDNRQKRCMYGFELAYRGFSQHRPFVYYLSQSDHTSPKSIDPTQRYDYSSQYLGAGSTGSLFTPNLSYQAEIVGEWGTTFSEGALTHKDHIGAWAANAKLEYLFDVDTHPRISAEYIFGSGDGDRRTSATSTIGGNLLGTKDKAFNAFGFRDTGIAFAPRISNIHIYVVGARFFPFEKHPIFKKMELGTKVFFYQKDQRNGPTSDTTSVNNSAWLGWEWDIYCNWRLTSDLAITTRYGCFQPGAAYNSPTEAPRHFLYTALMFSF